MKLAIVTETFPPEVNGVAMTFATIARELARRGHRINIYRPQRRDLPAGRSPGNVLITALPGFPVPGYPQVRLGLPAGRRLFGHWRRDRPDLVHVVTEGPLGASAVGAARRLGVPVTSSFHTNFHTYTGSYGFAPLRGLVLRWLRRVHNRTRCTFAPTNELCNELAHLGFRNLRVLSRGIDVENFDPLRRSPELRRAWDADDATLVVLHVGRMAAEKNYPLLFRTYAAIRAVRPKCRFVVAGEGPLRDQLAREHPECVFAGFHARPEIARYYASADVYIHASLTETFGNVVTEAMASGLAVAGFDYAAAHQFVRDGESGLLAPCDNPDELVAAGVRLATDDALRNRLRAAARPAVVSQSWDKVIGRFEADLNALTASPAT